MILQGQSDFLNLSRWVAAGMVVIEHARNLLFVDYGSVVAPSVMLQLFYFMTGFGHEAVIIFFVISGFLVGGKSLDDWFNNRFNWKKFLVNRISRLYAVLVAALVIGACLDRIGLIFFNATGYYTGEMVDPIAVFSGNISGHLSVIDFLGNLFMMQDILVPTFGSNGPLWSLAHEWWYYLLFPLSLMVLFGRGVWQRVVAISAVIAICILLTEYILVLFAVWLIGVGCWLIQCRLRLSLFFTLPCLIAALVFMRLEIKFPAGYSVPYVHHFVLGVAYGMILNSFSNSKQGFLGSRVSRFLADFSYTVYLIHFPVLLFSISAFFTFSGIEGRLHFNWNTVLWYLSFVTNSIIFAFLISLFTERRTKSIRIYMNRFVNCV